MPPFSADEMRRRIENLRQRMTEDAIDCVIATSYAGSYYLSGAPIHAFGRPIATLIPRKGAAALVMSIIERDHVLQQSWITDLRTYWDYNPTPDYSDPKPPLLSWAQLLRETLTDRGLDRSRLGFEEAHLPVQHLAVLREALPDAEFIEMSETLNRLRMVMSDEELHLIRQADEIADIGQEFLIRLTAPGRSAADLTEQVRTAMTEEILNRFPDKPFHLHVGCGLGSVDKGSGHSEWTTWNRDDRIQTGQLLETVLNVWLWGYWGNVERAIYVGEPTAAVRRAFEIMIEANEAAIGLIRPGVRIRDIDRAAKDVLARYGYGTRSGSGCGRGIVSYEGNARELATDLRLYSDVVLQPGMALSVEPDLLVPEIGTFRHCNTVIVTEHGGEVDSRVPQGMIWV